MSATHTYLQYMIKNARNVLDDLEEAVSQDALGRPATDEITDLSSTLREVARDIDDAAVGLRA